MTHYQAFSVLAAPIIDRRSIDPAPSPLLLKSDEPGTVTVCISGRPRPKVSWCVGIRKIAVSITILFGVHAVVEFVETVSDSIVVILRTVCGSHIARNFYRGLRRKTTSQKIYIIELPTSEHVIQRVLEMVQLQTILL